MLFEGTRAVGVEWLRAAATRSGARAAREVILSAGAIQSPQLLQLSGIGPADLLEPHGIAVVVDRPTSARTCRTTTRRAPSSG